MPEKCPFEEKLNCSPTERLDEFYRNMDDAMLSNKPMYFITGGKCGVFASECMRLREFREKLAKAKVK